MFRYLIIIVFSVITGCAQLTGYFRTASPLLPNTTSLPCCWQVLEQLEIEFQGEQLTLTSVTAVNDDKLTVVILDPMGRRIFAIIQQGDNVKVEKSDLVKESLPVEWLLIGVYLRHMPDDGWSFEHSSWTVERNGIHVLLMQENMTKVRLVESVVLADVTDNTSSQGITAQLQYPELKLNVNITTLLRQSLD